MVSTKGMLRRHIFFKQSTYLSIFDNAFKWVLCWRRIERGVGSLCHWQQSCWNSLLSLAVRSKCPFRSTSSPLPKCSSFRCLSLRAVILMVGLVQLKKHWAPMGRGTRKEWMRRRWSGWKSHQPICHWQNSNVGLQSETPLTVELACSVRKAVQKHKNIVTLLSKYPYSFLFSPWFWLPYSITLQIVPVVPLCLWINHVSLVY